MSAAICVVFLMGLSQAYAFPIDIPSAIDLPYDYLNAYGSVLSCRSSWPIGSVLPSDPLLDAVNPFLVGADVFPYASPLGYPKTVDIAKENFIRGSIYGPEVGTRDEVTIRPSGLRSPYSRFYSSYYPLNYLRSTGRYPLSPLDYDLGLRRPLTSALLSPSIQVGLPDALYLKK